jgi:hypothetical protein
MMPFLDAVSVTPEGDVVRAAAVAAPEEGVPVAVSAGATS